MKQHSQRVVWPLGLFFWGAVWTLGVWCELRHGFRIFRLDRIQKLEVLEEKYLDEAGKALNDLIEYAKNCSG